MAKAKVTQKQEALTSKEENQHVYGVTESQLRVLGFISDAADGLKLALCSKRSCGGVRCDEELQVFGNMADSIAGSIVSLSKDIMEQELNGEATREK
jgi:hypothetical protein